MKLFSIICTWVLAFGCAFFLGTDAAFAQDKSTAQGFVTTFSRFLEAIILPLLFSIAFLFFIYNTAKYFIFHGDEDGSREEGRRNAIYGIAAFVFLVSIWFIVGLFIQGFDLTQRTSICADYFSIFNKNCATSQGSSFTGGGTPVAGSGSTGGGGGNSGSGGSTGGGTGGGSDTDGSGSGGTGTDGTGGGTGAAGNDSPLAELIFGTGKDGAGYHRSLIASNALTSTPNIPETTSCIDGINTLKLAARAEGTQAAYVYYKTNAGQKRWTNITDRTNANYIGYDRDVLDDIISAGVQDVYIIHMHPDSRVDGLGLPMNGHGPSVADMTLMCTLNNPAVTYVTVDETNVWTLKQTGTTCPYLPSVTPQLHILETYITLASLDSSQRAVELTKYLASSLVPATPKSHFGSIGLSTLSNLSSGQILALADPIQTAASTTVSLFGTTEAFCTGR